MDLSVEWRRARVVDEIHSWWSLLSEWRKRFSCLRVWGVGLGLESDKILGHRWCHLLKLLLCLSYCAKPLAYVISFAVVIFTWPMRQLILEKLLPSSSLEKYFSCTSPQRKPASVIQNNVLIHDAVWGHIGDSVRIQSQTFDQSLFYHFRPLPKLGKIKRISKWP